MVLQLPAITIDGSTFDPVVGFHLRNRIRIPRLDELLDHRCWGRLWASTGSIKSEEKLKKRFDRVLESILATPDGGDSESRVTIGKGENLLNDYVPRER